MARFPTEYVAYLAIALCSYVYIFVPQAQAERVLLRDVHALVFHAGRLTTGRRSAPMPQITALTRGSPVPSEMVCEVVGPRGDNPAWKCKATMPRGWVLDNAEVVCEGYDYPEDPYILAGSCSVEFTSHQMLLQNDLEKLAVTGFFVVLCLLVFWGLCECGHHSTEARERYVVDETAQPVRRVRRVDVDDDDIRVMRPRSRTVIVDDEPTHVFHRPPRVVVHDSRPVVYTPTAPPLEREEVTTVPVSCPSDNNTTTSSTIASTRRRGTKKESSTGSWSSVSVSSSPPVYVSSSSDSSPTTTSSNNSSSATTTSQTTATTRRR